MTNIQYTGDNRPDPHRESENAPVVLARTTVYCLLICLVPACLLATEPDQKLAAEWNRQTLSEIDERIASMQNSEDLSELIAQRSWLQNWTPGRMPGAPASESSKPDLAIEPPLKELTRPTNISEPQWADLEAIQKRLFEVDTNELRKQHLPEIIELSRKLEAGLASGLPEESTEDGGNESQERHGKPLNLQWALAFARYRLGRGLAYRELPKVIARWPIDNRKEYEAELKGAYERLTGQMGKGKPEFILLEDRMLRRAGKKGQALELLEANKKSIDAKWYLKKRRDLLKELEWDPPYQEAAKIYFDAGYRDEP